MTTSSIVWIILSVYVYVVLRGVAYNTAYHFDAISKVDPSDLSKIFGTIERTACVFERILQVRKESYLILLLWSTLVTVVLSCYRNWYLILFFSLSCSGYQLFYKSYKQHKDYSNELEEVLDKFAKVSDGILEEYRKDKISE